MPHARMMRIQDDLIFKSRNEFGIPDLLPQEFTFPAGIPLVRYRGCCSNVERSQSICHFYLYDYMFESVWLAPIRVLSHVSRYWGVLTPDFSMYIDLPMSMQLWSVYRSRWVGRFWQEHGIKVIPTVNWSTPKSFTWCFTGIPLGQIVSVGVPDERNCIAQCLFKVGFEAMIDLIQPTLVIVYGRLPFQCSIAVQYPKDVIKMRQRINSKH